MQIYNFSTKRCSVLFQKKDGFAFAGFREHVIPLFGLVGLSSHVIPAWGCAVAWDLWLKEPSNRVL